MRERGLWWVLLALWMVALVPLWSARFLPLADLPDHLAGIALYHRFDDASWGYQKFYTENRILVPYWGHYFPTHLFSYFFSIETANKLFLSIYAAALPLSVLALGRRFGTSPWLAVGAFPLVFQYSFGWGFISCVAGMPLVLFGLAALDRLLEDPTGRRTAALAALTLATYFMHLLPWLCLGAAAIVLAIARRPSWRALGLAALAMSPPVPLALYGFFVARASGSQMAAGAGLRTWREPIVDAMRGLPDRLVMSSVEVSAWPVWLGLLASLALLMATLKRPTGARRVPLVWLGLALIGYFALPHTISQPFQWWNVSPRLLALAMLLALVAMPRPVEGWRRLALAPAIAAAIWYPLSLARQFREFSRRAEGFVVLMQSVPRGDSTLVMNFDRSPVPSLVRGLPFNEFNAYAQLLAGGYNPFPLQMGFPVLPREGAALPAPHWSTFVGDFRQPLHGAAFDFVITYQEPREGALFGEWAPKVPMVARAGAWRLYRTRDIR